MLIPLILALIVTLTWILSEDQVILSSRQQLISLSAGVSISYVILQLLPEFAQWTKGVHFLYLFILLGFVSLHLGEKLIYTRVNRTKRENELSTIHAMLIFLYYGLAGLTLVNLPTLKAIFFTLPILLHTLTSSIAHCGGYHRTTKNIFKKIFLHSSIFVGVFIGIFIPISSSMRAVVLGVIIGALLYTVIKEEVPNSTKGAPQYFVIGVLVSVLTLVL